MVFSNLDLVPSPVQTSPARTFHHSRIPAAERTSSVWMGHKNDPNVMRVSLIGTIKCDEKAQPPTECCTLPSYRRAESTRDKRSRRPAIEARLAPHRRRVSSTNGKLSRNGLMGPKSVSKVLTKVNSLTPNLRLVIALRSPNALLEAGLRMCLPEKSQDRDRIRCRAVRSLQSGLSGNNRKIRACFAYFGVQRPEFLCNPDCVAEGEGFEPSVQVLARTTV
jgi:hypothetical protein